MPFQNETAFLRSENLTSSFKGKKIDIYVLNNKVVADLDSISV